MCIRYDRVLNHKWNKALLSIRITSDGYALQSHCEHWVSEYRNRKYRVRLQLASGHSIFINWSIHNLVLYVLLFKNTLFNIYCWFINWTQGRQHNSFYNVCIFSVRYLTAFLHFRTVGSTLALHLGAILNRKINKKSIKMQKKGDTK